MEIEENHPFFRYCSDLWYFAVLLVTGDIIAFETMEIIDEKYVSIRMLEGPHKYYAFGRQCHNSPTSREEMVINKDHIVGLCELCDT